MHSHARQEVRQVLDHNEPLRNKDEPHREEEDDTGGQASPKSEAPKGKKSAMGAEITKTKNTMHIFTLQRDFSHKSSPRTKSPGSKGRAKPGQRARKKPTSGVPPGRWS